MGKYIDTKWLEDNAKEYSLGYYDYDEYAVPLSALDSAPSIDIVRCKDCRHYQQTQKGKPFEYHRRYCNRGATKATEPNDFCSYGVKRSEKPNILSEYPTGSERSSE